MYGIKKRAALILSDAEPWAIYTHCYGHKPNLGGSDCMKQSKVMRSACSQDFQEVPKARLFV